MTDLKNAQFIEGTDSQSFIDHMQAKLDALTEDAPKTSSELFQEVNNIKEELDAARAARRTALDNKDLDTARELQSAIEFMQRKYIEVNDQWFAAWKNETGW